MLIFDELEELFPGGRGTQKPEENDEEIDDLEIDDTEEGNEINYDDEPGLDHDDEDLDGDDFDYDGDR